MGNIFHLGGRRAGLNLGDNGGRYSLGGRGTSSVVQDPAESLVTDLLSYSPSLLLVGDLGTQQGDGRPCVAGDPLTAACATWQDQSGQGNHATQTTVMARPMYAANSLGGRGGLSMDSVDDGMLTACTLAAAGAGYCLVVVQTNQGEGMRTLQSRDINAVLSVGRGEYGYYVAGKISDVAATGLHVASISAVGGSAMSAHLDGSDITQFAAAATDWGRVALGATADTQQPANAILGAVCAVPYAARAAVTARLAAYYGITLSA